MENKVITLRTPYKLKEYHFTPMTDENGLRKPFVKPVQIDANGDSHMILSEAEKNDPNSIYFLPEDMDIVVTEGTTFDLSNPLDYNKWEAIKNSDLIVPMRDARDENGNLLIDGDKKRYGIAEIYVDVAGEDSERMLDRRKKIFKAQEFVFGDSMNGILTKCRLLGRNMNNAPFADAQAYLVELADKSPDRIIDLYTGQNTGLQLLLLDAKEKHIITKSNGWFMYGETNLGATDDAVISYLRSPMNKKLLDALKAHVYPEFAMQLNKSEDNSTTEETTTVSEPPVNPEKPKGRSSK